MRLRIRITMVTFFGKYTSKLDDKGRIVFPSKLKDGVPAGSDMRFVIKKSIYDKCLEMYTFEEWNSLAEKTRSELDFFNPDHVAFWREYMRDCCVVEPDAKFGRISIPRELLDAIGIIREVAFLGTGFKIEIWASESYEASRLTNDNYVAIARSLSRK